MLSGEKSKLSRPFHRPTSTMDLQLGVDILDMGPNGIGRDHEQAGDLLGGKVAVYDRD